MNPGDSESADFILGKTRCTPDNVRVNALSQKGLRAAQELRAEKVVLQVDFLFWVDFVFLPLLLFLLDMMLPW